MTLQLYLNPLDVLFYKCGIFIHNRCLHDSKYTYEIIYDIITCLPNPLISIINEYYYEKYKWYISLPLNIPDATLYVYAHNYNMIRMSNIYF